MAQSYSEGSEEDFSEVSNFTYKELILICYDFTRTVDSLEQKVKKLKSDKSKLVQGNNSLERKLEKVKNSPFSKWKNVNF